MLKKWLILVFPWVIWFISILYYLHQYFLRLSFTSLSDKFTELFHLNMISLSNLNNAFFYTFIGTQLLGGFLIDRFGVRIMLTLGALFMGAGCFAFVHSVDVRELELSRTLMGLGAPIAFLGSIKLIDDWFDKKYFQLLVGVTITIGSIGAFLGEGVLSLWLQEKDWHNLFFSSGVVAIILALLTFLIIRDYPKEKVHEMREKEKISLILSNVFNQLKTKDTWLIILFFSLLQVPLLSFYSFWAIHFFKVRFSESVEHASLISSLFFLFYSLGVIFFSYLYSKVKHKVLILFLATFLATIFYTSIIYFSNLSELMIIVLVAVTGIFLGATVFCYSFLRDLCHQNSVGTMNSIMSAFSIVISILTNNLIGWFIDNNLSLLETILNFAGYPYHVYSRGLGIIIIQLCLAMLLILLYGKRKRALI